MCINPAHPPKPMSYKPWLPHSQTRKLTHRLSWLHHLSATKGRGEGLSHYIQNRCLPTSRCFLPGICLLCLLSFPHGGGAGAVLFFFLLRTRLTCSSRLTFVKVPFTYLLIHTISSLWWHSHPRQSVTLWPNSVCYSGHCAPSTLELHLIYSCRFLTPLWFFSQR